MSMSNISKKGLNENKYQMLRSQLDKLQFIQPIDYNSLDAIEALINEILSLRQRNKTLSFIIDESQEKQERQALMLNAFKHQNTDLFKQNGELHHEVLSLLERNNFKGKEIELKRLTDDTSTLKYLLNASKEKAIQYRNELNSVKQKYLELIVSVYDKKVNLSKLFEEIRESDQILLRERGIEMKQNVQGGIEVQSKQQNSSSNNTNSNHTNSNNNNNNKYSYTISNNNNNRAEENHVAFGNKTIRSAQEMIEKIYRLEAELREKNNEIMVLKKKVSTENALDQKVAIDYLKTELKSAKEKYECYLKFQLDKSNKDYNNHHHQSQNNYTHTSPGLSSKKRTQPITDRKELIKINSLQKENTDLKGKCNLITKENIILKDDLKALIAKYEKEEKRTQNGIGKTDVDYAVHTTDNNHSKQLYANTEVNLITSMNEKVKESNARLSSSQQHFQNRLNIFKRRNKELESQIAEMSQQIKIKDKLLAQQNEQINSLNRKVFELSSEARSSSYFTSPS